MEIKFNEINLAYEILTDKKKKYIYDLKGVEGLRLLDGDNSMQRMDDDIFSMFGFGGSGLRKGQDLQITVPVSLEDIYLGKEQKVSFQKKVICSHCRGTGSEDGKTHKCSKCKGRGVTVTQQQMGYQIIQ